MEDKKSKITLLYNNKDFCAFLAYRNFLEQHIEKGNKIPARVLKKFMSFLEKEGDVIQVQINERFFKIKDEVIKRFSKDKKYTFNIELDSYDIPIDFEEIEGNESDNDIHLVKRVCSIDELINYIFYQRNEFHRLRDKDELITRIYKSIDQYFSQFIGDTEQFFSYYKRVVIVGFILYKLDLNDYKEILELDHHQVPTNEILFRSVNYRCKLMVNKKGT